MEEHLSISTKIANVRDEIEVCRVGRNPGALRMQLRKLRKLEMEQQAEIDATAGRVLFVGVPVTFATLAFGIFSINNPETAFFYLQIVGYSIAAVGFVVAGIRLWLDHITKDESVPGEEKRNLT